MEPTPILVDANTAGQLLDMLPARVRRLAKRGKIPAVILPDGEPRFLPDDLREWVEQYRHPASTGGSDDQ